MATYEAALDGRVIGEGGMPEVRAAVAQAATDLLALDPEGAAQGAQEANHGLTSGKALEDIGQRGFFKVVLTVKGVQRVLIVRRA